MAEGDALSLEIPASAEHVATARLFAATVARVFGLQEDLVADIKLAVSEATTAAVRSAAGETVVVTLRHERGSTVIRVDGVLLAGLDEAGISPIDVITALFPDTLIDGHSVIVPTGNRAGD